MWQPMQPKQVKSDGGAKLTRQPDGTYLAAGKNPPHDVYTITAPLKPGSFSGLLLECLADTLPETGLPPDSRVLFAQGAKELHEDMAFLIVGRQKLPGASAIVRTWGHHLQ